MVNYFDGGILNDNDLISDRHLKLIELDDGRLELYILEPPFDISNNDWKPTGHVFDDIYHYYKWSSTNGG